MIETDGFVILDDHSTTEKRAVSIETPSVPLDSDKVWDILAGHKATSGVTINQETTLGYPALWKGLKLISDTVGKLPLIVHKRLPDGSKDIDRKHPAYYLLKHRPSPELSAFEFKRSMQWQAAHLGNAYAYIFRNEASEPVELMILDPEQTFAARHKLTGELIYVTRIKGEDRQLLAQNILHLKGPGNGVVGFHILDVLRESLGLGLAAQKYGSVFFSNNAQPPYFIQLNGYLKDDEAIERFRKSFGDVHKGLDNSHKVGILENGATPITLANDLERNQFVQTREFELTQVANILGVPASKLGANMNTSYNSLELDNQNILDEGLGGWLCNWEQEVWYKLLREREKRQDSHLIEFNRKAFVQADLKTEAEIMLKEVHGGLKTVNEALAIQNKPGIGPTGDLHLMPVNLQFAEIAVEQAQANLEQTKNPPAPEPAPQPEAGPEASEAESEQDEAPESQPEATEGQSDNRLAALTETTVEKLVKRVGRAAEAQAKKGTLADWLADGLTDHRQVWIDTLEPLGDHSATVADAFFENVQQGLTTMANTTDLLVRVSDYMAQQLKYGPTEYTARLLHI